MVLVKEMDFSLLLIVRLNVIFNYSSDVISFFWSYQPNVAAKMASQLPSIFINNRDEVVFYINNEIK